MLPSTNSNYSWGGEIYVYGINRGGESPNEKKRHPDTLTITGVMEEEK